MIKKPANPSTHDSGLIHKKWEKNCSTKTSWYNTLSVCDTQVASCRNLPEAHWKSKPCRHSFKNGYFSFTDKGHIISLSIGQNTTKWYQSLGVKQISSVLPWSRVERAGRREWRKTGKLGNSNITKYRVTPTPTKPCLYGRLCTFKCAQKTWFRCEDWPKNRNIDITFGSIG